MIPAPCGRAIAPPNARLPTLETRLCSGRLRPRAAWLGLGRPGLLVFVEAVGIAHVHEDRARGSRARAIGRPFAQLYLRGMHAGAREEGEPVSRSSGPGCTSGRHRATSRSRPCRGASSRIGTGIGAADRRDRARDHGPADRRQQGRRTPPRTPRSGRKVAQGEQRAHHARQRATLGRREGADAGRRRPRPPSVEAAKGKLDRRHGGRHVRRREGARRERRDQAGHGPDRPANARRARPRPATYGVFNCFMPTTGSRRPSATWPERSATRSARSSTTTRSPTRGAARADPRREARASRPRRDSSSRSACQAARPDARQEPRRRGERGSPMGFPCDSERSV